MRRNYISPEFVYKKVNGTFNMIESSSFLGSKMLEIEDKLDILNKNILYYQSASKEQLDLTVESNNAPVIYNSATDKKLNHLLAIDDSQSQTDRDGQTKWIMNIDICTILTNYIFATMKEYRTFEGVKNTMTSYGDVDSAMTEYIKTNVVNRYRFTNIELYIKYRDLKSQNILRFKNDFNELIESNEFKVKRIQSTLDYEHKKLTVNFRQEKTSSEYSFEYYFNLNFEKI